MPQRYKLRLGDGTILQVDKDGLQVWVHDDRRAMVQVAGTQQWRALREFLAEEESADRLRRALIPPEPKRTTPLAPPEPEPTAFVPPEPPASAFEPPAPRFEPPPAAFEPPAPRFELPPPPQPVIDKPAVQVLAEEPSVPTPPWQLPPEAPGGEAPAIRFKAMEDEPPAAVDESETVGDELQGPYALARPRAYAAREREEVDRHDRLEGPLLHVLTAVGTLLSRLLDPLTPLAARWPLRPTVARESRPTAAREPRAASGKIPVVSLKPLDEDEGPLASAWGAFSAKAAGSLDLLSTGLAAVSARVADLPGRLASLRARHRRLESVVPAVEPVRRKAPSPAPPPPSAPEPRDPLRPPTPLRPTPIAELPSVRLKEGNEPPEDGDVYDGEGRGAGSVLPVAWAWTKRIVLLGGLVAAGVLVVLHWDAWFPRAAELGQTVFGEIDRQARSTQRTRERDQAFANAVERCPHLAPETIRLVQSTSGDGVLEPPAVFGVATEAADRGISTLSPAEAAELRALQRELASRLRPPQRARLAEYDRARATRVVFAFENPPALDLVARGARAMPAASRARLQHLLGEAVAAGLRPPAPAAPTPDAGAPR